MLNIIKYQLLNRLQTFRLAAPIVAGLNLLACLLFILQGQNQGGATGFIAFLAIASASIVPLVHFFTSGSGHVSEILNKDTSYLILSLPLSGSKILGGRMIAGLIEFVVYLTISILSLMITFSVMTLTIGHDTFRFTNATEYLNFLSTALGENLPNLLKLLAMIIFNFGIVGSLISFAAIASASLVRNRKAATIIAVIGALFVLNRISVLGTYVGERFAPQAALRLSFAGMQVNNAINAQVNPGVIELNVVSALFMLCAAGALFCLSAYFLEKKLEV